MNAIPTDAGYRLLNDDSDRAHCYIVGMFDCELLAGMDGHSASLSL